MERYKQWVLWLSNKWALNPYELDAVIYSESGRNPNAQNPQGSAYGLIQFIANTRISLIGTSRIPISMDTQFKMIDKYFLKNGLKKGATGGQIYACIFLPARANRKVYTQHPENFYTLNTGLDIDKNGDISQRDLDRRVKNVAAKLDIDFGIMGEILKIKNLTYGILR